MKSVYLETTIISYLAAAPSRDLVKAARQEITREWWSQRRMEFDAYISQVVIREASRGDIEAVGRRVALLEGIPVLRVTAEAEQLAAGLVATGPLPERAVDDALHLAVAAAHGIDYLLTWNCKHLANAELANALETWLLDQGVQPPVICTPDGLLERNDA
jgi:predicted nucleic acid-binding protein